MHRRHRLDKTTITVSRIGLGAMPLSLAGHPAESDAMRVIHAFIDAGGNFVDTANVYCTDDTNVGHNERLIAMALKQRNNTTDIIVASKGGLRRPKGDWTVDASPQWLRQSCEKSLADLGVDSLFLYQLHAPDPKVPLTESVGELDQLKSEGKIQHIGLSNVNVEHIKLALSITSIMSVQNRCNLFERNSFHDGVVTFCENKQISFIAHSPVGGHYQHQQRSSNPILQDIAAANHATAYQVMLAWLLNKSPAILPIPGATKISSVIDSQAASELALSNNDLERLDNMISV